MLKIFKNRSEQRGDTIIEVLVVLAVLGLAIGVSYGIANTSLLSTKGAQENAQATEILQAQLEAVRSMLPNDDGTQSVTDVKKAGPYCVDTSGSSYQTTTGCTFGNDGQIDSTGNGLYTVQITYDGTSTFTLTATWSDIHGQGQDKSTLVYRDYQ